MLVSLRSNLLYESARSERKLVACSRRSDSGKGAKKRATARRTASEKDAGKWTPLSPVSPRFFHSLFRPVRAFPHYLKAWNRLVNVWRESKQIKHTECASRVRGKKATAGQVIHVCLFTCMLVRPVYIVWRGAWERESGRTRTFQFLSGKRETKGTKTYLNIVLVV